MDILMLSSIRSSLGSTAKQESFDKLFQLPSFDPYGHIIGTFDVLKRGEDQCFHPYDFLYYSLIVEMKSIDDDFEIIAALAAAVLSKNFRGDFLVRQRLNWNEHE